MIKELDGDKISGLEYKGKNCPFFICEKCNKPILDFNKGMVKWDRETKEVKFYHKMTCDNRDDDLPWEELGTFILQLAFNSGFKEEIKLLEKKFPNKFPHYVWSSYC